MSGPHVLCALIAIILVLVWLAPEQAGRWAAEFQHGMNTWQVGD